MNFVFGNSSRPGPGGGGGETKAFVSCIETNFLGYRACELLSLLLLLLGNGMPIIRFLAKTGELDSQFPSGAIRRKKRAGRSNNNGDDNEWQSALFSSNK